MPLISPIKEMHVSAVNVNQFWGQIKINIPLFFNWIHIFVENVCQNIFLPRFESGAFSWSTTFERNCTIFLFLWKKTLVWENLTTFWYQWRKLDLTQLTPFDVVVLGNFFMSYCLHTKISYQITHFRWGMLIKLLSLMVMNWHLITLLINRPTWQTNR